jgi:sarcosine oxidase subunit alpha
MPSIRFEGRRVAFLEGDSVATALFRAGVRTFTRSIKHHRRRGLYCLSGDCASCLVSVDGLPGVRACLTDAVEGMRVRREGGWPSVEHDLLAAADRAHVLLPVGFYYKTFVRPRFAWPLAERVIRRATGVGRLPLDRAPRRPSARTIHADVVVVGAGVAGLSAARAAAAAGRSVVVADERGVGASLLPGAGRARIEALGAEVRTTHGVTLLERHAAVGVYEGPLVPLVGSDGAVRVRAGRVVVATGVVEAHPVFPGNDLPGVFLSRGAARLAAARAIALGRRIVAVVETTDGLEQLAAIVASGVRPALVVTALALPDEIRSAADEVVRDGRIARADGRGRLRGVEIEAAGRLRRVPCDALVVALGAVPRDGLLRMGGGLPVTGAGELVRPGCGLDEAAESGAATGRAEVETAAEAWPDEASAADREPPAFGRDGYVCPCEDVSLHDLERAWAEGWRSSEILKRYTTATMGPCQGALCSRHLARFCARAEDVDATPVLTTARPPARPVALEDLAAGVHEVVEGRTSLHERHLAAGAVVDRSGSWKRPYRYGDALEEYRAVRERASVMDVGTLGKFLVGGRDAAVLLDAIFASRIGDLSPGRARYVLALDEAGYVTDDGLVCALGDGRFVLTSTSGGADRMEASLRDRTDRLGLHVHLVNRTSMLGAINLAGPRARDVLERLTDHDVRAAALPHLGHADITVAGVTCHAIRSGFVGEVSFELHHPRSRGPELWDALLDAGGAFELRPHGLDALDVLRLERGHVYLGQDTLPDDHPWKLGLGWAVAMDKAGFVGRTALERMLALPLERRLVGLAFDAEPQRGSPLSFGGRIVGRVTSCAWSPALGRSIGLGWVRAVDGVFPDKLRARDVPATVVDRPFYDPEGARLRA